MANLSIQSVSTEASAGNHWSAAQVIEHLVMLEELLLKGHKKVIASEKTLTPGPKGKIFVSVIGFMNRAKLRFGTTPDLKPQGSIDLDTRLKDWYAIRETLTSDIDKIQASNLTAPYTIHPIAGPLDAESTLKLISQHIDYHIRNFPKA